MKRHLVQVRYGHLSLAKLWTCGGCRGKYAVATCKRCGGIGRHIELGGAYVYSTTEQLQIGDIVLVPGNDLVQQPSEATVAALDGGGYDGPVAPILRVVERVAS